MANEIRPQAGPQSRFLANPADIAIFGGAAGGGKSFGLLLDPLRYTHNPQFGAVLFRRTKVQIRNEGGLWDESESLYPLLGAHGFRQALQWRFPSGATISMSHLEHDKDRFNWGGSQIPYIGFDEMTHFTNTQFWYMMSRNRSPAGIPGQIRGTCNPDPDSFVAKLIEWWIDKDTGYPITIRAGIVKYFARIHDDLVWGFSKSELKKKYGPQCDPLTLTFIPASVFDNKILLAQNPRYLANLRNLPPVEREQLLNGNWLVRPVAGSYFKRHLFGIVDAVPAAIKARCRFWDRACLIAGTMVETSDGPKAIQDIKAGDKVLTRSGFKGVRWSGQTKTVSELVAVQFSNGGVVIGTGDHKVWTENRGWTRLDAITCGDYSLECGRVQKGQRERRTLKLSSLAELFTHDAVTSGILKLKGGIKSGSAGGRILCTEPFGDFTMARFQRASMCTTKTMIGITTPLKILRVSAEGNTTEFTVHSRSGTKQARPGNRGRQTEAKYGLTPNTNRMCVSSADVSSNHDESTCRQSFVAFILAALRSEKGRSWPVYDLEVEGAHEFFANGILVHNSTEKRAENDPDATVGLKLAWAEDGIFYIEDVVRMFAGPHDVEKAMKNLAQQDGVNCLVAYQQDPGSAGVKEAQDTARALAGFVVSYQTETGDKETRAKPVSSQVPAGNIKLVRGPWNDHFLRVLENFPVGRFDDEVDALSGAFNKLTSGREILIG